MTQDFWMILNSAQTWVQNTHHHKCGESESWNVMNRVFWGWSKLQMPKKNDACFIKAAGCVKVSQYVCPKTVRQERIINGHGSAPIVSIVGWINIHKPTSLERQPHRFWMTHRQIIKWIKRLWILILMFIYSLHVVPWHIPVYFPYYPSNIWVNGGFGIYWELRTYPSIIPVDPISKTIKPHSQWNIACQVPLIFPVTDFQHPVVTPATLLAEASQLAHLGENITDLVSEGSMLLAWLTVDGRNPARNPAPWMPWMVETCWNG